MLSNQDFERNEWVRRLRKLAVAFAGGAVLLVGIAMIALPGPAVVVIPAGLALLATEFEWARKSLHRVRETATRMKGSLLTKQGLA